PVASATGHPHKAKGQGYRRAPALSPSDNPPAEALAHPTYIRCINTAHLRQFTWRQMSCPSSLRAALAPLYAGAGSRGF
ncbi:MAG TPA: hypothetical protein VF914_05180, partial [Chloroflexia bacterium]